MSAKIQKPQATIWGITAYITPWGTAQEQSKWINETDASIRLNGRSKPLLSNIHILQTTSNALLRIGKNVVEIGKISNYALEKPVLASITRMDTPLYVVVCDRGMPFALRERFKQKAVAVFRKYNLENNMHFTDFIKETNAIMVPLSIAVQSDAIISNYTMTVDSAGHVPAISNLVGKNEALFKLPEVKPLERHQFPPFPAIGPTDTQKEIDAQREILAKYVKENFSCVSRKVLDSKDYDVLYAALVECNKYAPKRLGEFPRIDAEGKNAKRTTGKLRASISKVNLEILDERYCNVRGANLKEKAESLSACWVKVAAMVQKPDPKTWPAMNPKKAATTKKTMKGSN